MQPPMSCGTTREGCSGAPCLTQGQRPLMEIIPGDTQIIPQNIPLRALHCLKPLTSAGSPRGARHGWAKGCPCLQPGMGAAGHGYHSPKCPCEPGHLLQGQGCRGWGLSPPWAPAGPGPPHRPCCWRGWGLSPPRAPAALVCRGCWEAKGTPAMDSLHPITTPSSPERHWRVRPPTPNSSPHPNVLDEEQEPWDGRKIPTEDKHWYKELEQLSQGGNREQCLCLSPNDAASKRALIKPGPELG